MNQLAMCVAASLGTVGRRTYDARMSAHGLAGTALADAAPLDPTGVVSDDLRYRVLDGPGIAAELDALSFVPGVWTGAGNAELGHPAGCITKAADLDALLAAAGGFEILQAFTEEFSNWLAEPAWRAADAAIRHVPGPSPEERLEGVQRWMLAMTADLGVTASIPELIGPECWTGGEPHWDHALYVTAAFVHAARKCFPDAPEGIQHRHTIVVGTIFCGGAHDPDR
jgi:hypothetical protein